MGKRTIVALLVAMVIALGLVGCGSSGASSSQSGQSAASSSSEASQQSQASPSSSAAAVSQNPDAEFLPALAAGLEARWALTAKTEDQELTTQLREQYANAELDQLAAFKDASFEDADLGRLAERYIAAVEDSAACLDSFDTNYLDFTKRWSDSYKERALVIKELVEKYGFAMSGENQESINGMIEAAKEAEAELLVPEGIKHVAEEDIPAAVASAFQKDGDIYRATYVNPGPMSFDTYDLTVCLLNDKGGLVEQFAIHLDSWPSGSEATFEFTPNSEFASIAAYNERWHGTW